MAFRLIQGNAMDTQKEMLEAQADQLAEEALHELGDTLLDEPDEYADLCDYAGCYPWLKDLICVHPHEYPVQKDDAAIEDEDRNFYC